VAVLSIFQMLAGFAEYEKGTIRERTQAGQRRAFKYGRHGGTIPYGYDIAEDDTFVVVEDEARIVREIIANVAAGATLYSEAKRLNDEGVPSPGLRFRRRERRYGASWPHATVGRIVGQRAYSGVHEVTLNSGEVVERPVPTIVPPALQERAMAALAENKRYAGGRRGGVTTCCAASCTAPSVVRPTWAPAPPLRLRRSPHEQALLLLQLL
jgi:hypothetical protein